MRYKEHTLRKLEGQITKLKTLARAIGNADISAAMTLEYIDSVIKELQLVVDRLELESNE